MKDNWTDLRRAHSYTLALRFIDAAIRWHNYESAVDPGSPGATRFIRNCFCLARQLAERRRRQALWKHQQEGSQPRPALAQAPAELPPLQWGWILVALGLIAVLIWCLV